MHMADALLSPAAGGAMWAAAAAAVAHCSRKIQREPEDSRVPLMGVLGAFIFAAQMINFTIPATGSSGHLGGGLISAILLGPHAALLVMASVLTVQALFFADGGLLALGANIFNLGFVPCLLAYPCIYLPLAGKARKPGRQLFAAIAAGVAGVELGALGVVLQTVASGISELPFPSFALLMLPIHLAIGLGEGLATATLLSFVRTAQPDLLDHGLSRKPLEKIPRRRLATLLTAAALLTGGALSWFASNRPDGLEWSLAAITGSEELGQQGSAISAALAKVQGMTAILPDYAFRASGSAGSESPDPVWPAVHPGTSLSGVTGGLLTLLIIFGAGWLLRRRS